MTAAQTYTEIVGVTEDDGYYNWVSPATYSENCLIRIREQGSAVEGFSAFTFAIREPFIDILYPNGGENRRGMRNISSSLGHMEVSIPITDSLCTTRSMAGPTGPQSLQTCINQTRATHNMDGVILL